MEWTQISRVPFEFRAPFFLTEKVMFHLDQGLPSKVTGRTLDVVEGPAFQVEFHFLSPNDLTCVIFKNNLHLRHGNSPFGI